MMLADLQIAQEYPLPYKRQSSMRFNNREWFAARSLRVLFTFAGQILAIILRYRNCGYVHSNLYIDSITISQIDLDYDFACVMENSSAILLRSEGYEFGVDKGCAYVSTDCGSESLIAPIVSHHITEYGAIPIYIRDLYSFMITLYSMTYSPRFMILHQWSHRWILHIYNTIACGDSLNTSEGAGVFIQRCLDSFVSLLPYDAITLPMNPTQLRVSA